MYQDNEIIMLILGLSVFIFVIIRRHEVIRIPVAGPLMASFAVLVAAYLFTVLEGPFYPRLFNLIEHICYAVSSILLAVYAYIAFFRRKGLR